MMRIVESLIDLETPQRGSVLAIGNFDGVHIGHQAIIAQGRKLADEHGLPLIVMTFYPAPVKMLRPELAPRILTPIDVKKQLIAAAGVDILIVIQTTREFLGQEPETFVKNVVVEKLRARHVVEGGTFSFGKRRAGSIELLQELGQKNGFEVHPVPSSTLNLDGFTEPVAVSSTFVRQQIAACEFGQVRQCLGRYYELPGRVERAKGRGHEIGFPTANLRLYSADQLIPPDGVYAGYVRFGDKLNTVCESDEFRPAALSIGGCETFADGHWQIEAHILDFTGDKDILYNKHMLMGLVKRTRQQEKFDSVEILIDQIKQDCEKVKLALQNAPDPASRNQE